MRARFCVLLVCSAGLIPHPSALAAKASAEKTAAAPPASELSLQLDDLGFQDSEIKANAQEHATYERRTSMLQTHQILGLVTLGLMTGTMLTAREHQPARRVHQILGYSSAISYAATAYFSLAAPQPQGFSETGWSMKIHRALLFVHLPGMILTPIAGYLANKAYKENREPRGLAKFKGSIASATYFSFAAAAVSVTIDF
jgi:hypothetical protein